MNRAASIAVLTALGAVGGCSGSSAPATCRVDDVLREAARAYQSQAFTDVARYEIRVPGAEPKTETVEIGAGGDADAWLRMPDLFAMHVRNGTLVVRADGATDAYYAATMTSDLQSTVDAAFEGRGSPLVPPPLLLREAESGAARLQAFRSKLLSTLTSKGCSIAEGQHEITLAADNGSVRARFEPASHLLRSMQIEIATGPGQEPIRADASFAPRLGAVPPHLPADLPKAREVASVSQLTGDGAPRHKLRASDIVLTTADGKALRLAEHAGSVVIVEFWARWCAPCRVTMPAVEEFARWADDRDLAVRVLLVNTQENFGSLEEARAETARYLQWAKIGLPTAFDLDSSVHGRSGGGLPLTLVFGPDGELVETHAGFKGELEQQLKVTVAQLLGSRAG